MKLNNIKRTFLASAALLSTISMSAADRFVNFEQGDLLLNANNRVEIYMDTNDCKGVSYAAHALLKDIKSVSGATATLTSDAGFLKKPTQPDQLSSLEPSAILQPSTNW